MKQESTIRIGGPVIADLMEEVTEANEAAELPDGWPVPTILSGGAPMAYREWSGWLAFPGQPEVEFRARVGGLNPAADRIDWYVELRTTAGPVDVAYRVGDPDDVDPSPRFKARLVAGERHIAWALLEQARDIAVTLESVARVLAA